MNTRTTYQIEKEMSQRINQIRESISEDELNELRSALADLASEYASTAV